eukprot:6381530-Amphidinium_carterae.1
MGKAPHNVKLQEESQSHWSAILASSGTCKPRQQTTIAHQLVENLQVAQQTTCLCQTEREAKPVDREQKSQFVPKQHQRAE